MSLQLQPGHFTQHAFTSTLHDERHHIPSFNYYTVLMTALFFFTVLAWFNFALAWYGTLTTTDPNHVDQTMSTLGFAIIWTLVTVLIYLTMNYFEVFSLTEESEHPLLRGESRDISSNLGRTDVADIGRDVLGGIDMTAI